MSQLSEPPERTEETTNVPMPDIVRFVRQLSHDLRNHLNAAELQSAYITEIVEDPEVKSEMRRLRGMLSEMGGSLQRVSASLTQNKLTQLPYETKTFVDDLQQKVAAEFPQENASLKWNVKSLSGRLQIDPQQLLQAVTELFANAFQHGRGAGQIEVIADVADTDFVLKLREPKTSFEGSTANWGREPFRKVAHGHYGLGLHRARSIIEGHDGRLSAHYDSASSCLITTVVLPLLAPE